jgi:hypothetical protein
MRPAYAHCPYCGFPVVVHAVERVFPRRCRQCREEYIPGAPLRRDLMSAAARNETIARDRIALRSRVRQRRQSLK